MGAHGDGKCEIQGTQGARYQPFVYDRFGSRAVSRRGRFRPQAVSDRLHISARKLPLPLLGCQHAVIAVALDARAWDQYSQPLDQFQRCQAQLRAAIGLGLSKR